MKREGERTTMRRCSGAGVEQRVGTQMAQMGAYGSGAERVGRNARASATADVVTNAPDCARASHPSDPRPLPPIGPRGPGVRVPPIASAPASDAPLPVVTYVATKGKGPSVKKSPARGPCSRPLFGPPSTTFSPTVHTNLDHDGHSSRYYSRSGLCIPSGS